MFTKLYHKNEVPKFRICELQFLVYKSVNVSISETMQERLLDLHQICQLNCSCCCGKYS